MTGKISPKKGTGKSKNKIYKRTIDGPYTRIYLCTCKYSGVKWYSKTVKQIHPDAANTRKEYAYSCQFNFGISSYPLWFINFDSLILKYGWYKASNKGNNLSGISRDHAYSIANGWKNNIPPEIIRHPANCELIPHRENQSKNTKSNITLEELYLKISLFNQIYPIIK